MEIIECFACSHFCKIKNGQVGICGVRQNRSGKLYSLVYGKAVAVHIDPIEKKPLFHFLPGSFAYSFGTVGCNFRCGNCQNFDISQIFESKGKIAEYENLNWGYPMLPEQIVNDTIKNNCQSVAYTYNEPTVFVEYALNTMKLAKKRGLKNIWVSNGYMTKETLNAVIPYLDAINIDIKSFDNNFYQSNCGAQLQPVLDNCRHLIKKKIWLEITTLVIPSLSDSEKMLWQIGGFIKKDLGDRVPWHVSAFSGEISWKMKHIESTPFKMMKKAYNIGKKAGLKYVYAGNIWKGDMEDTYCPKCKEVAIERIGYKISRLDKKGKCSRCGTKLDIIIK